MSGNSKIMNCEITIKMTYYFTNILIYCLQDTTIATAPSPHPCGIICNRADYYTIPSLEKLAGRLDANGDCIVDNLSIGRTGFGSVFFPGKTNVANLDIDDVGK